MGMAIFSPLIILVILVTNMRSAIDFNGSMLSQFYLINALMLFLLGSWHPQEVSGNKNFFLELSNFTNLLNLYNRIQWISIVQNIYHQSFKQKILTQGLEKTFDTGPADTTRSQETLEKL